MKDRLLKFLKEEKISSTRFAEEIGVQPSSISHILSGRNNPGYDFIVKTIKRYTKLNIEWLLTGAGEMYKSYKQSTLFDQKNNNPDKNLSPKEKNPSDIPEREKKQTSEIADISSVLPAQQKDIERIVVFFKDHTFTHYLPEN